MSRRLVALFGLVAMLAVAPAATANTVTISTTATGDFLNRAGTGGPFVASTTGTLLGSQTFVTFCLEFNEYFTPGQSYNFTLSDAAVDGGVGGGNPDPLSDATRWLYYHVATNSHASLFTAGTLGGVAAASRGAVFQYAIWHLEQEMTLGTLSTGLQRDGYELAMLALASNPLNGTTATAWETLYSAGHRVYAMNLTSSNPGNAQDQLAYVRVPEPGSLLILGLGFLGVGAMLRRKHA